MKCIHCSLMKELVLSAGLAVFGISPSAQALPRLFSNPGESDFVQISNELSPLVETAFLQNGKDLLLIVRLDNPWGGKVEGKLVAQRSLEKTFELAKFPAEVKLSDSDLGSGDLKMRLTITWHRADGQVRQQETYFSKRTGEMSSFDLEQHLKFIQDRKDRIMIPLKMTESGKVSIVIRDEKGKHIRNLCCGKPFEAGKHLIEWDGRTETGNIAAPGKFTIHVMTHPGLEYEFKMMYDNGNENMFTPWGSNHGTMSTFTGNEKYVFAASSITEGGWAIVGLTPEGKFVRGYQQLHGTGIKSVFMAADSQYLYVFHGGASWTRGSTSAITLTRYNIETGRTEGYKRANFVKLLDTKQIQPLAGAAMRSGKLYICSSDTNEIIEINPETAELGKRIPCGKAGLISSFHNRLFLANEDGVFELQGEKLKKLFDLPCKINGFCATERGFFVSDTKDSNVKLFDPAGRVIDSIGKPGGDYVGKWQPERLVNPWGIYMTPDGKSLWTAEQRGNPKRLTRWSYPGKKILYEKFGSPKYGSPTCGFDPDKTNAWYGENVEWNVDLAKKTAYPAYVQVKKNADICANYSVPRSLRMVHKNGRTYIIGCGGFGSNGAGVIFEQHKDHSLKPVIAYGSLGIICRWIKEEDRKLAYAEAERFNPIPEKERRHKNNNNMFTIWTDRNNNQRFDPDEFQFAKEKIPCCYWGLVLSDLEFTVPCFSNQGNKVITLTPVIDENGIPQYDLKKAIANGIPLKDPLPPGNKGLENEAITFNSGRCVAQSSPIMVAYKKDGTIDWFMQNKWAGVHGSHNAPMPVTGEMQGNLFALGTGNNAQGTEIFALMGNHGRVFFLTSDGFYIDELFTDCRVSAVANETFIGGEAFGGYFGKNNRDGKFYLQGGSSGFRIYEIKNLDLMKRSKFSMKFSMAQLEKASQLNPLPSKEQGEKKAVAAWLRLKKGARGIPWQQLKNCAAWDKGGQVNVAAAYDDSNLYLKYFVRDNSPWVNNGKVWSQLFKTGDSIDFQLASDPKAKIKRNQAVPGDFRLLIAPFEGKNIAVLYRYKAKGDNLNPMDFPSPWRTFKVEDVRRLDKANITVQKNQTDYCVTAIIPLADLELKAEDLKGKSLRGDFGVIFGDAQGTINLLRSYWSNQDTGLVNDVPGEMIPAPVKWSEIKFGE